MVTTHFPKTDVTHLPTDRVNPFFRPALVGSYNVVAVVFEKNEK